MARRTYSGTRRRSSSTRRSTYRAAAPRRSYRARSTARRRSGGSSGRTIRLEIVAAPANPIARPEFGMKPAAAPRKAKF